MRRCLWLAWLLPIWSGCAANIETAAARHHARATALEARGDENAALREREAEDDERGKLAWRSAGEREVLPPLTAF